jgi:hypothetical protein
VLSIASLSGNLLQVTSQSISPEQPLSRREITAYGIPHDAIATSGQSFSLKLCKHQRPQLPHSSLLLTAFAHRDSFTPEQIL